MAYHNSKHSFAHMYYSIMLKFPFNQYSTHSVISNITGKFHARTLPYRFVVPENSI